MTPLVTAPPVPGEHLVKLELALGIQLAYQVSSAQDGGARER